MYMSLKCVADIVGEAKNFKPLRYRVRGSIMEVDGVRDDGTPSSFDLDAGDLSDAIFMVRGQSVYITDIDEDGINYVSPGSAIFVVVLVFILLALLLTLAPAAQ